MTMHKSITPLPGANLLRTKWLAAAGLLALAACTQTMPTQQYTDEQVQQAGLALQTVRTAYGDGNYGAVITQVARDGRLHDAPSDIRIEAMKLQAFSFCMKNYTTMCLERFQTILAIQPDFDLSDDERGHPQWGPVFEQAKQVQQ